MANSSDRHDERDGRDQRHADPHDAATDPRAAAKQDQVRRDHDALQESARRVEASVSSSVRDTPVRSSDLVTSAQQEQMREDHDVLQESARRVAASVPANVRDTPVQPANLASASERSDDERRDTGEARANADAARASARRVQDSLREDRRK